VSEETRELTLGGGEKVRDKPTGERLTQRNQFSVLGLHVTNSPLLSLFLYQVPVTQVSLQEKTKNFL
jgi:hypothetical protein